MKKLLALVLLGVAVKYLLDTEWGEDLKQSVRDHLADIQDSVGEGIKKATGKIEQAATKVDDTLSDTVA